MTSLCPALVYLDVALLPLLHELAVGTPQGHGHHFGWLWAKDGKNKFVSNCLNSLENLISCGLLIHMYKRFWTLSRICKWHRHVFWTQRWVGAVRCPGHHWAKLRAVQDIVEQSCALSRTLLSKAVRCPGHRWAKLSAVQNIVEQSCALSRTSLSKAECCPGHRWASCALSSTSLSKAVHCPGQHVVKFNAKMA